MNDYCCQTYILCEYYTIFYCLYLNLWIQTFSKQKMNFLMLKGNDLKKVSLTQERSKIIWFFFIFLFCCSLCNCTLSWCLLSQCPVRNLSFISKELNLSISTQYCSAVFFCSYLYTWCLSFLMSFHTIVEKVEDVLVGKAFKNYIHLQCRILALVIGKLSFKRDKSLVKSLIPKQVSPVGFPMIWRNKPLALCLNSYLSQISRKKDSGQCVWNPRLFKQLGLHPINV